MGRRRSVGVLILLVLMGGMLAACDSGYHVSVPPSPLHTPSAKELAAVETVRAEETHDALQEMARGTADALALEDQATRQALNLRGTQGAQEASATRQAWEFERTQEAAEIQATATTEARQTQAAQAAIDATATAVQVQATATAVQWAANVQGTQAAADAYAVEATRQAVERANERERVTQPLRAWWAWALLVLAIPLLIALGVRAAKVWEDRARVVRRKADEGEPIVVMTRDRMALPLRSFNALMDTTNVPALPDPEYQEKATGRQQIVNGIQARQTAATVKARKAHKSKAPRVVATGAALPRPRRKRRVPGLTRVIAVGDLQGAVQQGVVPPRLADAITHTWRVKEDEG